MYLPQFQPLMSFLSFFPFRFSGQLHSPYIICTSTFASSHLNLKTELTQISRVSFSPSLTIFFFFFRFFLSYLSTTLHFVLGTLLRRKKWIAKKSHQHLPHLQHQGPLFSVAMATSGLRNLTL